MARHDEGVVAAAEVDGARDQSRIVDVVVARPERHGAYQAAGGNYGDAV